ncbi:MAG: uroporphyrinogen-III synthase [Pseudomonadota bacterium]|nr:uroporphyrinogen-III synthase [Pseudomonadota bacterium]
MIDLKGLSVLVTRPAGQAAGLAACIEELGGQAVLFPAIEIQPPRDPAALRILPRALEHSDIAIFVSANAADAACARLAEADETIPDSCLVAAVGAATARRLAACGVEVDLIPTGDHTSESLLELPELQLLIDAGVVILRGDGGRPLLADTLRERGANVTCLDCYRRGLPAADPAPLIDRWRAGGVDIVTATSVATVDNLLTLLGEAGRALALGLPIVAISERVAGHCFELGWRGSINIAEGADDQAITDAILAWRGAAENEV